MALAVKTALPITLVCVAAAGLLSALVLAVGLAVPVRSRPDLEAVWLLGFGWFSNIVFFLPFVYAAYGAGLFLPRLTLPGLLLFMLFSVYVLERVLPQRAGRGGRLHRAGLRGLPVGAAHLLPVALGASLLSARRPTAGGRRFFLPLQKQVTY